MKREKREQGKREEEEKSERREMQGGTYKRRYVFTWA